jgi:predicted nucleic acid-binding Zn ribbon protein
MSLDSLRCPVPGCDDFRASRRDSSLGETCARHRYHAPPVQHDPRICPGCGSEFVPRRSDQVHCSKRCRNRLSARRTYTPRPRSLRRRPLTCEMCGAAYFGVWGRYCSRTCTNRAWKQRRRDAYLAGKRHYRKRAAAKGAA